MNTEETITDVKAKLTLTEVGVIVSLICSVITASFTGGIMYAQVQSNTDKAETNATEIKEIKDELSESAIRIERIDANVEFLTELAREERR